jgi:regulator of nonsense transcripts 3
VLKLIEIKMTLKNETISNGNNSSTNKDEPMRKIVVRRLPPTLKKEEFLDAVSPLPDYDYFYYCKADLSLGQYAFCRAYISFTNSEDVFIFKEKFDNYVFVDAKSNEYPAIVEYAPYQKRPKNKAINEKKDSKCGTIEQDLEYIKFVENMDKPEGEQLPSCELILEQIEQKEKELMANGGSKQSTPLLDYLKKKHDDRRAMREVSALYN